MKKRAPHEEIANWYFSDADLAEVASMVVDNPYHASVRRDEESDVEDIEEEEETHE